MTDVYVVVYVGVILVGLALTVLTGLGVAVTFLVALIARRLLKGQPKEEP